MGERLLWKSLGAIWVWRVCGASLVVHDRAWPLNLIGAGMYIVLYGLVDQQRYKLGEPGSVDFAFFRGLGVGPPGGIPKLRLYKI